MKYQGKGKTECGIVAKQRTQRNSTRKKTAIQNCSKNKGNDNKDTSKATERKANKQRRKETKAKQENHEAM